MLIERGTTQKAMPPFLLMLFFYILNDGFKNICLPVKISHWRIQWKQAERQSGAYGILPVTISCRTA
ncbi:hypothetical protein C4181_20530 [Clostridioides difficile]|nr:hypothetical protein [Clostridioides difficile]